MGVRVAAGKRESVESAIESGIIPNDTLIVTKDETDSGLMLYDAKGNLISISEKRRFVSLDEAQAYVMKYGVPGQFVSVRDGDNWVPFVVQDDFRLGELNTGFSATRIDGGSALDYGVT